MLLLIQPGLLLVLRLVPAFDIGDGALEGVEAVGAEAGDLADILGGEVAEADDAGRVGGHLGALARNGSGRQGKAHVARAVDELEDGAGGLVVVLVDGLDAEHARVAARAVLVALSQGCEEFREVRERVLDRWGSAREGGRIGMGEGERRGEGLNGSSQGRVDLIDRIAFLEFSIPKETLPPPSPAGKVEQPLSIVTSPPPSKSHKLTKRIPSANLRVFSVFLFASVINLSASRWASLALGHVVEMASCLMRDVTRLRSSACRCDDLRPKCRYLRAPPAILVGRGGLKRGGGGGC